MPPEALAEVPSILCTAEKAAGKGGEDFPNSGVHPNVRRIQPALWSLSAGPEPRLCCSAALHCANYLLLASVSPNC